MLDFKTWADKAASFITDRAAKQGFKGEASIKRPLSPDQVAELESSIQTKLPRELKLFLLHGSAGCQFRYEWTPPESSSEKISEMFPPGTILYGGASLCDASMLSTMLEDCRAWATETWIAEEADQQALWLNSFAIASLTNGDYLGLQLSPPTEDSPVVYLSHEAESQVISPSFTLFLTAWEGLCYIGPEIWLLGEFIDAETGFLSANLEKADKLRSAFRI